MVTEKQRAYYKEWRLRNVNKVRAYAAKRREQKKQKQNTGVVKSTIPTTEEVVSETTQD